MAEILNIRLYPRESECTICGVVLFDCKHGVPMYEDEVVSNDWAGEWVGRDACARCYAATELVPLPSTPEQILQAQVRFSDAVLNRYNYDASVEAHNAAMRERGP